MSLVACSLLAFALALGGTWLARGYALRRRLIDQPGERRSHTSPTPRGGGIAIVAAVLPALGWLAWRDPEPAGAWAAIAGGLLLVAGIGWLDDHRPLGPALRLVVHAVAAALLAWSLQRLGAAPWAVAVVFVAALVLVNVWNFMDGIDSLATSQAMVAALAYAGYAEGGAVALLGCTLAAACAGFLPSNLPPARIFLGDVGSGAIGFLLAVLGGLSLLRTPAPGSALLLLPLLVFLIDAGLTLGNRMLRGERWWQAHARHAYQAWARRSGSHGRVAIGYLVATLVCIAFMFAADAHSSAAVMATIGLACATGMVAWGWLRRGQVSTVEGLNG